jgi:hypothetical protein
MSTGMERAMNSEKLGARIMENGAMDQKIWALEVMWGKMVNFIFGDFSEIFGGFRVVYDLFINIFKTEGLFYKFLNAGTTS